MSFLKKKKMCIRAHCKADISVFIPVWSMTQCICILKLMHNDFKILAKIGIIYIKIQILDLLIVEPDKEEILLNI